MLSALIPSRLGYPALPLAEQLAHQRSVPPGPLVLRRAPLKSPTPTTDRDQPVSRRSEPSSRTALMGEQPNPWDLLQPQDATSRRSFYPLSHGPSTRCRRITLPDFRLCSTCRSHSQAPLCQCTRYTVSIRAEGTFGRLRYLLGGHRPSQTTHQTLSPLYQRVRTKTKQEWYFTAGSTEADAPASQPPTYPTHAQPKSNAKL
jgi:hypothetical protein